MARSTASAHFNRPVAAIARPDVATIRENDTVREALDAIRIHGLGDRIVYFYVVDRELRLVGVLPTRRLLTAPLDELISAVMISQVVTLPPTVSVLEAHQVFARTKLLALPVVDSENRIQGVIDVSMLTDQGFDPFERDRVAEIFETIGFRVSQVRGASPWGAFRFRFPWLLSTIGGGLVCAALAGAHELTLAKSLVLTFFLTLVLGLGESIGMQSMTLTIQTLRSVQPSLSWYRRALGRESGTALLLGVGCGLIVGLAVWLWRGTGSTAVAIGGSIWAVTLISAFLGLTIPTALHALKLDPKIAAGPITLALADVCTLLVYFNLAEVLL